MAGSDGYYAPLWSPDGQYLAAIQNPPKSLAIYSVKIKQWKQLKVFEHDWGFFVWAPDSKSLYSILGPGGSGDRRANRDLPTDSARREVGVVHEVCGVERAREWPAKFRLHHAGGQCRSNERYQRDPDLSDEMEERGVRGS